MLCNKQIILKAKTQIFSFPAKYFQPFGFRKCVATLSIAQQQINTTDVRERLTSSIGADADFRVTPKARDRNNANQHFVSHIRAHENNMKM
jgi:hypothetical protein